MRQLAAVLACAALLAGCGSDEPRPAKPVSKAARERALAGSPRPLADLHARAGDLLDGGAGAFRERLAGLHGYPVVVNKWASWCAPCRAEFPYFQREALKRGRKVAFLGVNANDNDGAARKFLGDFPVPYPSYKDPNLAISAVFKAVQAFPVTAYYDRKGQLAYVHQGGYPSERRLAEDIERYAR